MCLGEYEDEEVQAKKENGRKNGKKQENRGGGEDDRPVKSHETVGEELGRESARVGVVQGGRTDCDTETHSVIQTSSPEILHGPVFSECGALTFLPVC